MIFVNIDIGEMSGPSSIASWPVYVIQELQPLYFRNSLPINMFTKFHDDKELVKFPGSVITQLT